MPDRAAFAATVYLLRTGSQWNALPRELGASSTVHDRFQEWEQAGVFHVIGAAGLAAYDELHGIAWDWQAADGVMTNSPFGGAATGPNPTDRGKRGVKRRLLTDGLGIPLAVVVDGANRHDVKLIAATLNGVMVARPDPTDTTPQHLCLDAGYDYPEVRQEVADRGYVAHLRSRGVEQHARTVHPDAKARRWVVDRTHRWLNRSRRLLGRWEKKRQNYLAFLHLACAQLLFANRSVSG